MKKGLIATGIIILFIGMAFMPANAAVKVNKTEIKNITEEPTGFFHKNIPIGQIKGKMEITKVYLDPKDTGYLLIEGISVIEGKDLFGITIEPLIKYKVFMEVLGIGFGCAFPEGEKLRLRVLFCQDIPENLEVGETIGLNTWGLGIKATIL